MTGSVLADVAIYIPWPSDHVHGALRDQDTTLFPLVFHQIGKSTHHHPGAQAEVGTIMENPTYQHEYL